jgi:xanthine/uracil/vitamin C permease (AzgA family)
MSATIAVVAVLIWLFAMGASWCLSWTNALSAIFVAGVIVIGAAVSWQRVGEHKA